jgi:hypothetical protein
VPLRKIDALIKSTPAPFDYGNVFDIEDAGGRARLVIGFDQAQDACVRELSRGLRGPFQVLYVLHTSRADSDLGRYESPELTSEQVDEFIVRFGRFLAEDARHDFWLRSHDDDATIVLDRHNVIYAYGPLAQYEEALLKIGARRGAVPPVPDTHMHYYHAEWDEAEREVLKSLRWVRKPLRDSDVQFKG